MRQYPAAADVQLCGLTFLAELAEADIYVNELTATTTIWNDIRLVLIENKVIELAASVIRDHAGNAAIQEQRDSNPNPNPDPNCNGGSGS